MNPDVVVVGAGPVGLFLAIELALAGVRPLVIERLAEPDLTIKSGAVGAVGGEALVRRGLGKAIDDAEGELFAAMLPEVRKLFTATPLKKLGGHFSGLFLIDQMVQRDPERRYRGISQAPLEKMLAVRATELGIEVRRSVEMTSFTERGDGVEIELAGAPPLRARYLVGCDGGRSRVRKLAGFDFPGTAPTFTGWQALVDVDAPEKLLPFRWTRTKTGVVTYGPMPGRIMIIDFAGPPTNRDAPITAEELESALHRTTGTDVRVLAVKSATRFTDHARQATTYRKGRVFIAGDAAHVHSPFGGQGINLGLVDAANLGWKLGRDLRGTAGMGLLDSYSAERHPVGARVLANTRAQSALIRPDELTTHLREIMSDLMKLEAGNQYFGELMSGISTRYDLGDEHPLVGRLANNMKLELSDREARLYDLMQSGEAVLFGPSPHFESAAGGRARVVRTRSGPSMFIRPDGCIAWANREGEEGPDDRLAPALDRWLGAA